MTLHSCFILRFLICSETERLQSVKGWYCRSVLDCIHETQIPNFSLLLGWCYFVLLFNFEDEYCGSILKKCQHCIFANSELLKVILFISTVQCSRYTYVLDVYSKKQTNVDNSLFAVYIRV
jgi:hypothetical protein